MVEIILKYIPYPIIAILLLILISIFRNPEKVDKWSAILGRLFIWNKERREKNTIAKNIDYRVTKIAKKINNESRGILPFGIRIKWKKPDEVLAYIQKKNVVVVMKRNDNLDSNIVEACLAYVPKALLPKSRNIVDTEILDTIDHYIIQKMLSEGNYTSAYNYYLTNVLDDKLTDNTGFAGYFKDVGKIDAIGFLTRVLLEEYNRLGEKLFGTLEEQNFREETKAFIQFLTNFTNREPGDDSTPLFFGGEKIKIAIILFAKSDTLEYTGLEAYTKRITKDKNMGAQRIFLFSYAKRTDKLIYDDEGYVKDFKEVKEFKSLEQIEKKCKEQDFLNLIKKEKYYAKDVKGNQRTAMYYLYEIV